MATRVFAPSIKGMFFIKNSNTNRWNKLLDNVIEIESNSLGRMIKIHFISKDKKGAERLTNRRISTYKLVVPNAIEIKDRTVLILEGIINNISYCLFDNRHQFIAELKGYIITAI